MTFDELMVKVLEVFPNAVLAENTDGSIVIEPGFYPQLGTDQLGEYDPGE